LKDSVSLYQLQEQFIAYLQKESNIKFETEEEEEVEKEDIGNIKQE